MAGGREAGQPNQPAFSLSTVHHLPISLTSDVLQHNGQGCRQLSWGPKGTVAQLLIGTDACGDRESGQSGVLSPAHPSLLQARFGAHPRSLRT